MTRGLLIVFGVLVSSSWAMLVRARACIQYPSRISNRALTLTLNTPNHAQHSPPSTPHSNFTLTFTFNALTFLPSTLYIRISLPFFIQRHSPLGTHTRTLLDLQLESLEYRRLALRRSCLLVGYCNKTTLPIIFLSFFPSYQV